MTNKKTLRKYSDMGVRGDFANQTSSMRRRRFPPVRLDLLDPNCEHAKPEKEFATNLQQHRAASFRVAPSSSSKYKTTDMLANSRRSWP